MTATPVPVGTLVLNIDTNGAVAGVYDDRMGLQQLGALKITRFGEVVYNETTGLFDLEVKGAGTPEVHPWLSGFATYTAGTAFERQWLASLTAHGIDPSSPEGLALAKAIRWP